MRANEGMTFAASHPRPLPGRWSKRGQERDVRTWVFIIEGTISCVREEGFAGGLLGVIHSETDTASPGRRRKTA